MSAYDMCVQALPICSGEERITHMGLFDGPSVEIDPRLASIYIGFADDRRKAALKYLGKYQSAILAVLEREETPLVLICKGHRPDFVLVTNQRTVRFEKSEMGNEIGHSHVAEIELVVSGHFPRVILKTAAYGLDYLPDDPMRFRERIDAPIATPRQATMIKDVIEAAGSAVVREDLR